MVPPVSGTPLNHVRHGRRIISYHVTSVRMRRLMPAIETKAQRRVPHCFYKKAGEIVSCPIDN